MECLTVRDLKELLEDASDDQEVNVIVPGEGSLLERVYKFTAVWNSGETYDLHGDEEIIPDSYITIRLKE